MFFEIGKLPFILSEWIQSAPFVPLCLLLILFIIIRVRERQDRQSLFAKYGISFVKPHFIYGSLHELRDRSDDKNELEVIEEWIGEHGKIFGYYVGYKPYLLVADIDAAREILLKRSSNYINRPKLAIKAEPVTETLVGLRDDRWREVRKVLSPAFTSAKLKLLTETIHRKIDILISLIDTAIDNEEVVDFLPLFQGFSLDVISSCAFAMETHCMQKQETDPFFAAVRKFLKDAISRAILWAQYFPFVAFLMTVTNKYWTKSGKATQMVISNLKNVIDRRRKMKDIGRKDLLQIILNNSNMEQDNSQLHSNKSLSNPLSDKEIIANAWVFLLGGYETTAMALSYTSYLLAQHSQVQQRLYDEISNSLTKEDDRIGLESALKLKYLDQVFNESLRLYPPVSSFVQREAAEEDEINGFIIPKETNVVVPIWHIHHDPHLWTEPFKFEPDRFLPNNRTESNLHPLAFIPFGAGPRNCIGMKFGQAVVKLALIRIMNKFRLECCRETPTSLTLTLPTVTLIPKEKIILKAIKREL